MNKKEVLELKKLIKPESCSFTRICGCYVDAEKQKKAVFDGPFLSLPEESLFKYMDILKKGLSGTIGKNLFNLDFPLNEEKEGEKQELLLKLRDSKLKDEELLDMFYDKVIESYATAENYLILLVHNAYDVPGRGKDGLDLDDASEEVFSYVMCVICPVTLSKGGLSYHAESGDFQDCTRNWIANPPEIGFLFPAFNNRSTDLHAALYHIKKASELHEEFVTDVLGCKIGSAADEQKSMFQNVVQEVLGDNCTFDNVKDIISKTEQMAEERREEIDTPMLTKAAMLSVLEDHLDDDKEFSKIWDQETSSEEIVLDNVSDKGKCKFKMDNVEINTTNGMEDVVEIQIINGRKYLTIPYDGTMELNGIKIFER